MHTVPKPELSNASVSIVVSETGIVIKVNLEQPWNALAPILVTLLGIVLLTLFEGVLVVLIVVNLEQPWNVLAPIVVKLLLIGRVTLVNLVQP